MTAKEIVLDRLEQLPEDVSLEQIKADVEALIAIEESEDDIRNGRVFTHEEVVEMSNSWITRKSGLPVP